MYIHPNMKPGSIVIPTRATSWLASSHLIAHCGDLFYFTLPAHLMAGIIDKQHPGHNVTISDPNSSILGM